MPRIDPQQLLKCLSVLLSPSGGIKSKDEVHRLASLMTKFSKKLVSKCIYVSILKATETDLLIMFMSAGGWDLTFSWLSDGVSAKNWPLVVELVDLLLVCPVDIDRLKTNACPKLIKTLSKDTTADEKVRLLACKLVEQWLRVVRGDNEVPSLVPKGPELSSVVQVSSSPPQAEEDSSDTQDHQLTSDKISVSDSEVKTEVTEGHIPVYKITNCGGKKILEEISRDHSSNTEVVDDDGSTGTEDVNQEEDEEHVEDDDDDEDFIKPVKLHKKVPASRSKKQIAKKKTGKVQSANRESDSSDSSSSIGKSTNRPKPTAKTVTKKIKIDSPKAKTPAPKGKINSNEKIKETKSLKSATNKTAEDSTVTKPKERMSLSLKNRKTMVSKNKPQSTSENKTDKVEGKEKNLFDDNNLLTDKEKESLSKLITPPISKVGKIPKKTSVNKEEKQSEEKNRTLKEESPDKKMELKKNFELKKPDVKRSEKKYSISVEPKRPAQSDSRPKTVKTYNSKFRSTGLEEEVRPPPPRPTSKKPTPPFTPVISVPEKKISKRSSPPPETHIPEKKSKPEVHQEDKKPVEKVGGIKLIPPKPKPMFLQESDVFMDAMLAANTIPRKRKRRASTSKDSAPDSKKDASHSPNTSPKTDDASPSSVKPTFKFYQDTLDTSTEDDKSENKMDEESLEFAEPNHSDDIGDDQKSMSSEDEKVSVRVEGPNGPLKGVLVHLKTRRQKKSVTWKEEGLECIKYFELDETERVNVTKNFADMKNMEREHERENFQIARKLAVDDIMEERTRWRVLIPIDIAAPVVAPGKNSQEKDIQYAREKTVPAAVYFNKRTIPDSAAEPDLEIHATTDPVAIPLDDITGGTDSINDFTNTPWPEPRGQPPVPAPAPAPPLPPAQPAPAFPPAQVPGPFPPAQVPGPFPMVPGPFMPGPAPGMPMPPAGDCWRTGDGKVVPMGPEMFPPQGMMPPGMPGMGPPGPIMLPPGVTPEMAFPMGMPGPPGPNPTPEEMAHFGPGFAPMGPSPPHQMFGPPPPPPPQGPQGNFQGGGNNNWQGSGGGNWYGPDNEGPPHHNQGGGRYQGSSWRGGRGGNRNRKYSDGWGGGNTRVPICNNILKRGFCRNNSCRFRHPR